MKFFLTLQVRCNIVDEHHVWYGNIIRCCLDYENLSGPTSSTNNQFFPPSTLAADSTTKPSSSTLLTLSPPNPGKQASLAEAIQRSIFSSPPVLQPVLASKILLCGGSTSFPNFARRLYCELRPLLPEVSYFYNVKKKSTVEAAFNNSPWV